MVVRLLWEDTPVGQTSRRPNTGKKPAASGARRTGGKAAPSPKKAAPGPRASPAAMTPPRRTRRPSSRLLGGVAAVVVGTAIGAVLVAGRLLPEPEQVEATDDLVPSQRPAVDSGLAAGVFVTDLRPTTDPGYETTPLGTCADITEGAISYRNETGRLADTYLEIGRSRQDRPIWAEHWGSVDGPQLLVVGQVHGNECSPAWFVRAIRESPPPDFGIWLIPTLNPDGLAAHKRRNAVDVDINRDGRRLTEPETRALVDFTDLVRPTLSIHVHSPLQWVGWHNSRDAQRLAEIITDAVGWGTYYTSGVVESDRYGFLWEAQDEIVPGHPSVLIEFPAVSRREATNYVNPEVNRYVSVTAMDRIARTTLEAIASVFGSVPSG